MTWRAEKAGLTLLLPVLFMVKPWPLLDSFSQELRNSTALVETWARAARSHRWGGRLPTSFHKLYNVKSQPSSTSFCSTFCVLFAFLLLICLFWGVLFWQAKRQKKGERRKGWERYSICCFVPQMPTTAKSESSQSQESESSSRCAVPVAGTGELETSPAAFLSALGRS